MRTHIPAHCRAFFWQPSMSDSPGERRQPERSLQEMYEQLGRENDRLRTENEQLRDQVAQQQRGIERLKAKLKKPAKRKAKSRKK